LPCIVFIKRFRALLCAKRLNAGLVQAASALSFYKQLQHNRNSVVAQTQLTAKAAQCVAFAKRRTALVSFVAHASACVFIRCKRGFSGIRSAHFGVCFLQNRRGLVRQSVRNVSGSGQSSCARHTRKQVNATR
jgi:hypothetical protein